jgi:hypothetical protein
MEPRESLKHLVGTPCSLYRAGTYWHLYTIKQQLVFVVHRRNLSFECLRAEKQVKKVYTIKMFISSMV